MERESAIKIIKVGLVLVGVSIICFIIMAIWYASGTPAEGVETITLLIFTSGLVCAAAGVIEYFEESGEEGM